MSLIEFKDGYCMCAEGLHFEAKEAKGEVPRSLWETYSAFANTDGGTIILGLKEEDGGLKVVGVSAADSKISNIWSTLNNPEKISLNILSDEDVRLVSVDGKDMIVMDIPRASRTERPVFIDGNDRNSFRRNGEGDYRCRHEEVVAMITDSASRSPDRRPVESLDVGDLSQETVAAYRNYFRTGKPDHYMNGYGDDEFMKAIGAAVSVDGVLRPTVAGLMMFGIGPRILLEVAGFFLEYREYGPDSDEWTYRTTSWDGDWSGNLFDFYARVMNRISQLVLNPLYIGPDMKRVDDPEILKCIREAVINALSNADYGGRGGVTVEWRPDRFEVRNPGSFRIPIRDAMEGGFSDPRNQAVSVMFALIGDSERAGTGIPRMSAICRTNGLDGPRYSERYS